MKKIIFTFLIINCSLIIANAQYGWKWVLKPSGTTNTLYSAYFSGSSSNNYAGLICGSNGTLLVSTDGYNTWVPKSTGTTSNLYCIIRVLNGYNNYLCCGDNGTIIFSTNSGNNWSQVSTGTNANLKWMASYPYSSTYRLFAVGDGGLILYSTWTGSAWSSFSQLQSGTIQNFNSITVNGNLDATICGNSGTVLKSTNGGMNWFQTNSPTNQNLHCVTGYGETFNVFGNNGLIYYTTNMGQNWTQDPTGVTTNLFYNYGSYVTGSDGTVLSYINNWERIPTPVTYNLYYTIPPYFFGGNGTILKREIDSLKMQVKLDGNNISTYMSYAGVFDQNRLTSNTPGFEWPINSGKNVIFTTGLSVSCMINGQLAQTMCSYAGEYYPGAILNGQFYDSSMFKPYKVIKSGGSSQPDWQNWGCMVPYGAPFVDVNNNGTYEPLIDTPGVKNATQTIFVCLTDINPNSHSSGEGFGGGIINPLMGIELHLTKWAYSFISYSDVVFTKFEIINKGGQTWNRTRFAIVSDPDVGSPDDDFVGCDTVRNMGYAYNRTNNDPIYGIAPPAVGYDILKGPVNKRVTPNVTYNMTSFTRFINCNANPPNECDPNGEPLPAFILMQGFKKDSASWLDRTQQTPWGSYKKTKKIFYGDPETNEGWTAAKGYIVNYGNDSVGTMANEIIRDMRFTLGMGAENYTILNGDTAVIWLAQLVARGTSNLNSVTKLKQLSDLVQAYYESNFTIKILPISSEIPLTYRIEQNFPNPFNPTTKIKFDIPLLNPPLGKGGRGGVSLKVYDILGREISTLVNEKLQPGSYEVTFDASQFPSGIYFYQFRAGDFVETKKMLMIK